jgi:Holliday junction resolvase RusA-like endonuclease
MAQSHHQGQAVSRATASVSIAPETVMLYLPEPPSANVYWRSVVIKGRVRVLLSSEARQFKKDAEMALRSQRIRLSGDPLFEFGEITVRIFWHRQRKSGDLDNRIKPILDCLKGVVFADDKQVVEIHATRSDDKIAQWPMVVHVTRKPNFSADVGVKK